MEKKKESKKVKDYYTTFELINEPWFPVRSTNTIKRLIESGKLKAYDVSMNLKFKRYKILKKSAIDFVNKLKNKKQTLKIKGL